MLVQPELGEVDLQAPQRPLLQVARAVLEVEHRVAPALVVHVSTSAIRVRRELAVRALLLGIVTRRLQRFALSRALLDDAVARSNNVEGKWVGGVALFEGSVLELKEAEALEQGLAQDKEGDTTRAADWARALKEASAKLDKAISISGSTVDLSSRLDSRINLLRDEIAFKREKLGLPQ